MTITSAPIHDNFYYLYFGINPGTAGFPVDVEIDYLVTSTSTDISGIDSEFPGGTTGTIFEQACTSALSGTALCPQANTVSSLTLATGNVEVAGTPPNFGPVSQISIHLEIDSLGFSEFDDSLRESTTSTTPEPATAALIGCGLIGLAWGRRLRRG